MVQSMWCSETCQIKENVPGSVGGKAESGEDTRHRSWATPLQCSVDHVKVWGFYSKCNIKPIKDPSQGGT